MYHCDNKLEPRQQVAFEEAFMKVAFIFLYFEITESEYTTNEIEMAILLGMVKWVELHIIEACHVNFKFSFLWNMNKLQQMAMRDFFWEPNRIILCDYMVY